MFKRKRCYYGNVSAFTLAEVLITLGIIGVVAAMTIPSLIADHRRDVTETRLKKFYSIMNQAILQSINDNGEPTAWSYFVDDAYDDDGNIINQSDNTDASFQKYLAPYLKIIGKKEVKDNTGERRILYFLADGSSFAFAKYENRDIQFYPKNGEKCMQKAALNSQGVCAFSFTFYPISKATDWKYHYNKGMESTLYRWDGTEEKLYNDNIRGCNNIAGTNATYCTAIIQRNGWKVPKDYPRRLSF